MKGIYQILSPVGEIYIGQTSDLSGRIRTHRYKQNKKTTPLHTSFIKHGFDSHEIQMLHELPDDVDRKVMTIYEQLYIDQHLEFGTKLLNQSAKAQYGFDKDYTPWNKGLTTGKPSPLLGRKASEKERIKISAGLKKAYSEGRRKEISKETRQKMLDSRAANRIKNNQI